MGTNWLNAPLSDYEITDIDEQETGYSYYRYVHPKGQVIILRINEIQSEIRVALGDFLNRQNLTYVTYDKLQSKEQR